MFARKRILAALFAAIPSATLAADPAPLPAPTAEAAAPAVPEAMLIDLATSLRLVDEQSPAVGFARARVDEAVARVLHADVLWLPNLTLGASYFRHTGVDQNRRGDVFLVNRSNVFAGGGPQIRFDFADAIYLPLVARRVADAAAANAQAVRNDTQFEAASAYLDLLRVYAAVAVNADTLARAEQMLRRAEAADKTGLSKTKGDVNRARSEVELRREERIELEGRVGAASAKLGRVLFLPETADLKPADLAVVPITLVDRGSLDELVQVALASRPELAANRSEILAANERVKQARCAPLYPTVVLDYAAGTFGGGRDGYIGNFNGRGDFTASAVWGLDNLGFGNRAEVRTRQAQLAQVQFRGLDEAARIRGEVLASAKLSAARYKSLTAAQTAVTEAIELYRKLDETSFGMIDKKQYDALEPLTAIQQLNQARLRYLDAVIEYNRAQFRLYTALGNPPATALPTAAETPVAVPASPPTFVPPQAKGK